MKQTLKTVQARAHCKEEYRRGTALQPCLHQGHTLLELIIALALGMVLTSATLSLYRSQKAAFERMTARAHMADAGFSASRLILTHLHLAGFSPLQRAPFNAALFGCHAGRPVNASDAEYESVCQPNRALRSDGLEVRYSADSISTWPASNGSPTDCLGQAIQASSSSSTFAVNRFFVQISPSTGKPELYCEGSGRRGVAQPLVEDVERLRIRYRLVETTAWLDASALQPKQWRTVAAVELCIQVRGARSAEPISYLDCDGGRIVSADRRHRQTFKTQVALRNASLDGPENNEHRAAL